MSILEKAYLKATELESNSQKKTVENNPEVTDTDEVLLTEAHRRELVTVENEIANMRQNRSFTSVQLKQKKLIHANMPDTILLNRYRNLRTKLLSLKEKKNFITLITSPASDYDTSLFAANLAIAFSLDEAKTSILMESNIDNQSLSKLFELTERQGLIDYLYTENLVVEDILNQTGINRLRFISPGQNQECATECFTSEKMNLFLQEIVTRYPDRYLFINSPCIANSADTQILINECDQVILVVPYGKCSEEEIVQAARAVGEEKLAGIVLDSF